MPHWKGVFISCLGNPRLTLIVHTAGCRRSTYRASTSWLLPLHPPAAFTHCVTCTDETLGLFCASNKKTYESWALPILHKSDHNLQPPSRKKNWSGQGWEKGPSWHICVGGVWWCSWGGHHQSPSKLYGLRSFSNKNPRSLLMSRLFSNKPGKLLGLRRKMSEPTAPPSPAAEPRTTPPHSHTLVSCPLSTAVTSSRLRTKSGLILQMKNQHSLHHFWPILCETNFMPTFIFLTSSF